MVNGGVGGQGGLMTKAVSEAAASSHSEVRTTGSQGSAKSVSDFPAARIDDSPSPSIGIAAARLLDIDPEKERRRRMSHAAGMVQVLLNSRVRESYTTTWVTRHLPLREKVPHVYLSSVLQMD